MASEDDYSCYHNRNHGPPSIRFYDPNASTQDLLAREYISNDIHHPRANPRLEGPNNPLLCILRLLLSGGKGPGPARVLAKRTTMRKIGYFTDAYISESGPSVEVIEVDIRRI